MELDDLKNDWADINNQVKEQQNLDPKIIDQMTHTKYNSSLKKIVYPEVIGITVCLAAAVYVGLNFSKLNTILFQTVGAFTIIVLLALSVVGLLGIQQLSISKDINKTYSETLKQFAVQKIRFHKLLQLNITLSFLLLVLTIILLPKLFGGKDITDSKYFLTFLLAISFGYIFLLFFSKWVSKKYNKTLQQAEELLKELAS